MCEQSVDGRVGVSVGCRIGDGAPPWAHCSLAATGDAPATAMWRSCKGSRELLLGPARCPDAGRLAPWPPRHFGGSQPVEGGLLADSVALADLGGAQPFDHIQPDKLLTVGCLAGTARQTPGDAASPSHRLTVDAATP